MNFIKKNMQRDKFHTGWKPNKYAFFFPYMYIKFIWVCLVTWRGFDNWAVCNSIPLLFISNIDDSVKDAMRKFIKIGITMK